MSAGVKERLGLRAAPWLLWFAVLGGGVAWSLHTVLDWGIEEVACRAGRDEVAGLPLRPLLGALTLLFLLVAVASTVVAFVLWRRLRTADEAVTGVQALRRSRAGFMALIGLVADLLFTLMIIMGGLAVLVIPVCAG